MELDATRSVASNDRESFFLQSYGKTEQQQNLRNINFRDMVHRRKSETFAM